MNEINRNDLPVELKAKLKVQNFLKLSEDYPHIKEEFGKFANNSDVYFKLYGLSGDPVSDANMLDNHREQVQENVYRASKLRNAKTGAAIKKGAAEGITGLGKAATAIGSKISDINQDIVEGIGLGDTFVGDYYSAVNTKLHSLDDKVDAKMDDIDENMLINPIFEQSLWGKLSRTGGTFASDIPLYFLGGGIGGAALKGAIKVGSTGRVINRTSKLATSLGRTGDKLSKASRIDNVISKGNILGVSGGHMFAEGYKDYEQSRKALGLEFNEDEAFWSGIKNMPAAVFEAVGDAKLFGQVSDALKGTKGLTVGKFMENLGTSIVTEGATEGMQEAWKNFNASVLSTYDYDREIGSGVGEAILLGAMFGGLVSTPSNVVQSVTGRDTSGNRLDLLEWINGKGKLMINDLDPSINKSAGTELKWSRANKVYSDTDFDNLIDIIDEQTGSDVTREFIDEVVTKSRTGDREAQAEFKDLITYDATTDEDAGKILSDPELGFTEDDFKTYMNQEQSNALDDRGVDKEFEANTEGKTDAEIDKEIEKFEKPNEIQSVLARFSKQSKVELKQIRAKLKDDAFNDIKDYVKEVLPNTIFHDKRNEQRTLQDDIDELFGEDFEKAREYEFNVKQAYAQDKGIDISDVNAKDILVGGSSTLDTLPTALEGLHKLKDIATVYKSDDAVLVAVEEIAEGRVKRDLETGKLTESKIDEWIKTLTDLNLTAATGWGNIDLETASTEAKIEWMSSRAVEFFTTKNEKNTKNLPKSILDYLSDLWNYLSDVIAKGRILRQLDSEGKLDQEFINTIDVLYSANPEQSSDISYGNIDGKTYNISPDKSYYEAQGDFIQGELQKINTIINGEKDTDPSPFSEISYTDKDGNIRFKINPEYTKRWTKESTEESKEESKNLVETFWRKVENGALEHGQAMLDLSTFATLMQRGPLRTNKYSEGVKQEDGSYRHAASTPYAQSDADFQVEVENATNISGWDDALALLDRVEKFAKGDLPKFYRNAPIKGKTYNIAGVKAAGFNKAKEEGKTFIIDDDGIERFEMNTADIDVTPMLELVFENDIDGGTDILNYKMSDLIDWPELYDNYPDAKDIKVTVMERPEGVNENTYASYSPYNKRIYLYRGAGVNVSSLVHELQHWIQDFENYPEGSRGASYERLLEITQNPQRYVFSIYKHIAKIEKENSDLKDDYIQAERELEAAKKPYREAYGEDFQKSKEYQKVLPEILDNHYENTRRLEQLYGDTYLEYRQALSDLKLATRGYDIPYKRLTDVYKADTRDAIQMYWDDIGEREARAAQARINMNAEHRASNPVKDNWNTYSLNISPDQGRSKMTREKKSYYNAIQRIQKRMEETGNDSLTPAESKELAVKKKAMVMAVRHSQRIEGLNNRIEELTMKRVDDVLRLNTERVNLTASIKELESIVRSLPVELRGRFRGFGTMAEMKSEKSKKEYLENARRRVQNIFTKANYYKERRRIRGRFYHWDKKVSKAIKNGKVIGMDNGDELKAFLDANRKASSAELFNQEAKIDKLYKKIDDLLISSPQSPELVQAEKELEEALTETNSRFLFDENVTADQLNQFEEDLDSIIKDGITKFHAREEQRREERKEAARAIIEQMNANTQDVESTIQERINSIKGFSSTLLRPETAMHMVQGTRHDNQLVESIFNPLFDAETQYQTWVKEDSEEISEIFKDVKINFKDKHKLVIKKDGEPVEFTTDELMAIYAYSQNEAGLIHLENTIKEGQQFNLDFIHAVIQILPDDAKKVVDSVIDHFDSTMYERLNDVFKGKTGISMVKEDRYFPIISLDRNKTISDIMKDANIAYGIGSGMTKARVKSEKGFKELAFVDTVGTAITKTNRYAAYAVPYAEAQKLWNYVDVTKNEDGSEADKNFTLAKQIHKKSPTAHRTLDRWLDKIAAGTITVNNKELSKWITSVKNNVYVSVLSSPKVVLTQPVSIASGIMMSSNPVETLGRSFTSLSGIGAINKIKFANKNSNFMANRGKNLSINLQEMAESNEIKSIVGLLGGWDRFKEYAMKPMMVMDKIVSSTVWEAEYKAQMNEHGDHKKAVSKADELVRQTQSTADVVNSSSIYTSNNILERLLTSFTGDINQTFNNAISMWTDDKSKAEKMMKILPMVMIFPALYMGSLAYGYEELLEELELKDDKDKNDSLIKSIASEAVGQTVGWVPVFGNIAQGITENAMGSEKAWFAGDQGNLVFDVFEELSDFKGKNTIDAGAKIGGVPFRFVWKPALDEVWELFGDE